MNSATFQNVLWFISRGYWSVCKVIAEGRGFLSRFKVSLLIIEPGALQACLRKVPVVPSGHVLPTSSPHEGSSPAHTLKVNCIYKYCQPKPYDKLSPMTSSLITGRLCIPFGNHTPSSQQFESQPLVGLWYLRVLVFFPFIFIISPRASSCLLSPTHLLPASRSP